MKKAMVLLAILLAGTFLALGLLRRGASPGAPPEETAQVDPNSRDRLTRFWSTFQKATRLRTGGDFRQAAAAYQEALRLDPNHEESLYYLGNCLTELGDYPGALELYERLLEIQPDSARGFSRLGMLLSSPLPGNRLDLDRARQAFRQVARINPEQSGPFLRLGDLALLEGQLPQALEHYRTAAGFRSPEGIYLAGMVLYRMGRFEEARAQFEAVLDIEAHEGRIADRGASSEGDLKKSESAPRTPLQLAALKSRILLAWSQGRSAEMAPDAERMPSRQQAVLQKRVRSLIEIRPQSRVKPGEWQDFGGLESLERRAVNPPPSLPETVTVEGPVAATAMADVDGDGREDLYVATWESPGSLWRNLGEGRFQDVTAESGLAAVGGHHLTAVFLDYDGDSQPDLLVGGDADPNSFLDYLLDPTHSTARGAPRLFRNQAGHFLDVTESANLNHPLSVLRALVADVDRDSRPDLILIAGALDPEVLLPSPVLLNRQGRFEEFAWLPGLSTWGPATGGAAGDFDSDGRIEVYLAGVGLFRIQPE